MTTPDEPTSDTPTTPDPGGARLRARAKVSRERVRPEVADAVTGLEQSLVDVATWERVRALEDSVPRFDDEADLADDGADDEGADDAIAPAPADDIPPPPGAPGGPPLEDDIEIPLLAARALPPPPPGAPGGDEPLLTRFQGDSPSDEDTAAGPVLAGAARVRQGQTQAEEEAEEAERRRRKGKVLSWSGVVLLLVVAAIWLIPNRDKDDGDKLPAVDDRATSTTDDSLLFGDDEETSTTVLDTSTTVPATVAPLDTSTTATTKKPTTATTKKPTTATTKAPTATTAPPATTPPTLAQPGPCFSNPRPAYCSSTTTQPPATTTTVPPTTTTTSG